MLCRRVLTDAAHDAQLGLATPDSDFYDQEDDWAESASCRPVPEFVAHLYDKLATRSTLDGVVTLGVVSID